MKERIFCVVTLPLSHTTRSYSLSWKAQFEMQSSIEDISGVLDVSNNGNTERRQLEDKAVVSDCNVSQPEQFVWESSDDDSLGQEPPQKPGNKASQDGWIKNKRP